jgi:nitroreductase
MELAEAIRHRRSVRDYTPEFVTPEQIARLIEAATLAPSAVNTQPWHFTIVRDRTLLDRISADAKRHMLALVDAGHAPSGFRDHLGNPAFQIFYHAPALILISVADDDAWAHENAALAAENLMLAAFAEGLGSCWIGFAQRWLETPEGRLALDLPAGVKAIAPIIVGHPRAAPPDVPRNAPRLHWIG